MTIHDIPPNTTSPEQTPARSRPRPRARTIADTALVGARILSGLFAGFFLTYAMSVVVGLARVDDITYVSTFQAINATIRNPTFAIVFFGAVPVCLLAAALTTGRQRVMLGAGTALLFATMAITFAFNVPLNDQLATYVDIDAASAAVARAEFEDTWNRWNLLRTCTAVLGAVCVAATMRNGTRTAAR